jgi:hypothetical protein
MGPRTFLERRLTGLLELVEQLQVVPYAGTVLGAGQQRRVAQNARFAAGGARRRPSTAAELQYRSLKEGQRRKKRQEEKAELAKELLAQTMIAAWTFPLHVTRGGQAAVPAMRERWERQVGAAAIFDFAEPAVGQARVLGTRAGVEAFQCWFKKHEVRQQHFLKELGTSYPLDTSPPDREGYFEYVPPKKGGWCRWQGCREWHGTKHRQRRRHEQECGKREQWQVPLPEIRDTKAPRDEKGRIPDADSLRKLSFAAAGEGISEEMVEARSTLMLRHMLQKKEGRWRMTLPTEIWDEMHAGGVAPSLYEALCAQHSLASLNIKELPREEGLEISGFRDCIIAFLAYLQTVAYLHGGRLTTPRLHEIGS